MYIINCTISSTLASEFGSLLYAEENYDGTIFINYTDFTNNSGFFSLCELMETTVFIENCKFINNTSILFNILLTSIFIRNSMIFNEICLSSVKIGCLMAANSNSSILIETSSFENITDGIYIENSNILTNKINIKGTSQSCITALSSNLTINHSVFSNYNENCLFMTNSDVFLYKNTFFNNTLNSFESFIGVIILESCSGINLQSSNFFNNFGSSMGSSLYLSSYINENLQTAYIFNNSFINNVVLQDGTIYLLNINVSFINNSIISNEGLRGAGIFSIVSNEYVIMRTYIYNNTFKNNIAYIEGGAIKWNNSDSFIKDNTFINNKAMYGKDIAAFPFRISLIAYMKDGNNEVYYDSKTNETELILDNLTSGNEIPYILRFEIRDIYDEIITLNNS